MIILELRLDYLCAFEDTEKLSALLLGEDVSITKLLNVGRVASQKTSGWFVASKKQGAIYFSNSLPSCKNICKNDASESRKFSGQTPQESHRF